MSGNTNQTPSSSSALSRSRGRDGGHAARSTCLGLLDRSKDCILRIFRRRKIPQGEARHGLPGLPKECLLSIICRLSVPDACQLRLVCKALRAAVDADEAWEPRLPVGYKNIIEDGLTHTMPKKQLYQRLHKGILLNNGTLAYWVDLNAREACFMLSARALQIVWMDDPRYWSWKPIQNSRFKEAAYLEDVCWFEVRGQLETVFQPGSYTVSFSVGGSLQGYWSHAPARFTLDTSNGYSVKSARFLQGNKASTGQDPLTPTRACGSWTEYDAGEFLVETEMPVKLEFSMTETESNLWKSGLLLEGVKIRPSCILPKDGSEVSQIR